MPTCSSHQVKMCPICFQGVPRFGSDVLPLAGSPTTGLVTSARIVIRGGHADVHVWVKGAKAGGCLTLSAGQWGPFVDLLGVPPDRVEIVHDSGVDVLPGQMPLLGDTVAGGPPFGGDYQGDADAVAAAVAAASQAPVPDDGFDSAVDGAQHGPALRGDGLTTKDGR